MDQAQTSRQAIRSAIAEINAELPPDKKITAQRSTPLSGPEAALDSLGLLSFLVAVECHLLAACGRPIRVMREEFLGQPQGPLGSLGSLEDFCTQQLSGDA